MRFWKGLAREVHERFPDDCIEESVGDAPQGEQIKAHGTGYIQIVDFAGLDEIARDAGCRLELRLRPGDFVHPGIALVGVVGAKIDDAMREAVQDCFSTGVMRSRAQDIEFLIDELVEIALRALSPGINDPFTAVTAMPGWARRRRRSVSATCAAGRTGAIMTGTGWCRSTMISIIS
jgi:uncharacterized membrane protein